MLIFWRLSARHVHLMTHRLNVFIGVSQLHLFQEAGSWKCSDKHTVYYCTCPGMDIITFHLLCPHYGNLHMFLFAKVCHNVRRACETSKQHHDLSNCNVQKIIFQCHAFDSKLHLCLRYHLEDHIWQTDWQINTDPSERRTMKEERWRALHNWDGKLIRQYLILFLNDKDSSAFLLSESLTDNFQAQ